MTMTIIPPATPDAPETPRSLEVLLEHLRAALKCSHCGAAAGTSCTWLGRKGAHLARFIDGFRQGLITATETAVTMVERLNLTSYYRYGMASIVWDGAGDGPRPAPQLYVVWEIDDRDPEDTRRTVVTDPMSLAAAELFAEQNRLYFAGRLEVAPARPEDLDDAETGR